MLANLMGTSNMARVQIAESALAPLIISTFSRNKLLAGNLPLAETFAWFLSNLMLLPPSFELSKLIISRLGELYEAFGDSQSVKIEVMWAVNLFMSHVPSKVEAYRCMHSNGRVPSYLRELDHSDLKVVAPALKFIEQYLEQASQAEVDALVDVSVVESFFRLTSSDFDHIQLCALRNIEIVLRKGTSSANLLRLPRLVPICVKVLQTKPVKSKTVAAHILRVFTVEMKREEFEHVVAAQASIVPTILELFNFKHSLVTVDCLKALLAVLDSLLESSEYTGEMVDE